MFEKLKELINKRREKKSKRLILNADFWRGLREFKDAIDAACDQENPELSREEVELMIEKWRALIIIARNAKEVAHADS